MDMQTDVVLMDRKLDVGATETSFNCGLYRLVFQGPVVQS